MASIEPPDDPVARNRDVDIRAVLLFGVWLVAGTIAVSVGIWGLFRLYYGRERARDRPLSPLVAANLRRTPPEPRLEANPRAPRLAMRAEEDALLMSYAWVDQNAGIVRVPIDRAMEILAARGLPPSKPMAASSANPSSPAGEQPLPASSPPQGGTP